MNLLIHDLPLEEWEKIADDYKDCTVISDNGTIRPCAGCFGCWNRDPGRCVIKDGYGNMGELIHHAEKVTVISRYTYGGFSGFVKNVFDRSLGYVLPHFELVNGESHHKKRYDEEKPYTFIFYGHHLSEEEKETARSYVKAVTTNMRTHVSDVIFRECPQETKPSVEDTGEPNRRLILLNASMRYANGNSAKLAAQLDRQLTKERETVNLVQYLNRMDELLKMLEEDCDLVLCMPLYVDGLPSQLIRMMEMMQEKYKGKTKKVYILANMGLYENRQLASLFEAVRQWCRKMDFDYCGGLGVSAGELVGGFMDILGLERWPLAKVADGMNRLSRAVNSESAASDIFCGPHHFPRFIYIAIANSGWKRMAKKNGIREKDLYRQL